MPKLDPIAVSWTVAAVIAAGVVAAVVTLRAIDSRPVVDYGAEPHGWFFPDHAKRGDKIQQCFVEINWHRPQCPGEYHWSWKTPDGSIKTGAPHKISNPPGAKPRQLIGKCREFEVPSFAEPGLNHMMDTYAANRCSWWHSWDPIRAAGPTEIPLKDEP